MSFVSLLPAVLCVITTVCGTSVFRVKWVQFFITGCAVAMLLSIQVVDEVTFDCRWWRNTNQDKCKSSFNTYVAGAFFMCLAQVCLLVLSIYQPVKSYHLQDEL